MKNNLDAAADRLDALAESDDEAALSLGIAIVLPTLKLAAVRDALEFYRWGVAAVKDPLGRAMLTAFMQASGPGRDTLTALFPDAFIPLDALLTGDPAVVAVIEEFVETRALPEGTLESFTSWEAGATSPIPDTGLAPWEGYQPVKIGDRVRVTSDPVPWAISQAEAEEGFDPEKLAELRAVAERNVNKVGVEFDVTNVAFLRNGSRLSAVVQGDPDGRGMLVCNLEVLPAADATESEDGESLTFEQYVDGKP